MVDSTETVRSTTTHIFTIVRFANPFLVCDTCAAPVEGYVNAPGHAEHMENFPCRHPAGITSLCPSWGPVDGCRCTRVFGYVPHGRPDAGRED